MEPPGGQTTLRPGLQRAAARARPRTRGDTDSLAPAPLQRGWTSQLFSDVSNVPCLTNGSPHTQWRGCQRRLLRRDDQPAARSDLCRRRRTHTPQHGQWCNRAVRHRRSPDHRHPTGDRTHAVPAVRQQRTSRGWRDTSNAPNPPASAKCRGPMSGGARAPQEDSR
jgi:hypothetical protein